MGEVVKFPEQHWRSWGGSEVGWIYFIGQDDGHSPIKVGWTSQSVESRLRNLQTGNYRSLKIFGQFHGAQILESAVHKVLWPYRVRGEWFAREPALRFLAQMEQDSQRAPLQLVKSELS